MVQHSKGFKIIAVMNYILNVAALGFQCMAPNHMAGIPWRLPVTIAE